MEFDMAFAPTWDTFRFGTAAIIVAILCNLVNKVNNYIRSFIGSFFQRLSSTVAILPINASPAMLSEELRRCGRGLAPICYSRFRETSLRPVPATWRLCVLVL